MSPTAETDRPKTEPLVPYVREVPPMPAALTRFRVMAYVVGVMLLLLVFVAMPLKYLGGEETAVTLVGPAHGFLYAVYLVVTFDLGTRARWSLGRLLLVLLAGTIPFLSFVAERRVAREAGEAGEPGGVPAPVREEAS